MVCHGLGVVLIRMVSFAAEQAPVSSVLPEPVVYSWPLVVLTHIFYYLGPLLYVAAAVCAVVYVRTAGTGSLEWANRLAWGGASLLALTFVARWIRWGRLPLTTSSDALVFFLVVSTCIMLLTARREHMHGLLCFFLPSLALICIVNTAFAHLYQHQEPRALPGLLLAAHVGLVFVSYAMFFVASMTSMAYVFQAQGLKRHKTSGLFHRLPPLEKLDHMLFGLIGLGYPLFILTLILGICWAMAERELLGVHWWLSPKIMFSLAMVIFYAVTFHVRRFGQLRGPKLAYLVFIGFTVLLLASLVLGLMNLMNYNFWDTPS